MPSGFPVVNSCRKCSKPVPKSTVVNGKKKRIPRRYYCLDCSPWGTNNRQKLEITRRPKDSNISCVCILCATSTGNGSSLCYTCTSRVRRYRTKKAAVELLGGKCNRCSWDRDIAGLEFHHPDDNKEFTIGNVSNRSWKIVRTEVMKCELLCSSCHRIEHRGIRDANFLSVVASYNGMQLE
jgi:hypothetical protein